VSFSRLKTWDVEFLENGIWHYSHSCLGSSFRTVWAKVNDGTQMPRCDGLTPEDVRVKLSDVQINEQRLT
jgi:hypothetical protein